VIERANDTVYGLASYFYTNDYARIIPRRGGPGLRPCRRPTIAPAITPHEIPFGGFKESGLGREGGKEGMNEYMEIKSIVVEYG